jgi:hypothetical protein
LGEFGLEWKVNVGGFKIFVEILPKSFQNIILRPEIVASVTNAIPHLMEIKLEVVPKCVNP